MHTAVIQLKTFVTTIDDYTTNVFEIQDERDISLTESYYVMCVKYPNWDQDEIKIGDIGYLHFKEVIAGVDKWFRTCHWRKTKLRNRRPSRRRH